MLKPGGVDNLKLVLKLQLTHNHGLIAAILQSHACLLNAETIQSQQQQQQTMSGSSMTTPNKSESRR